MPFDEKKFDVTTYHPREESVKVPELKIGHAELFGEDEEAVFIVRGLTGPEIALSNSVSHNQVQRVLDRVNQSFSGTDFEVKASAIAAVAGASDEILPINYELGIEYLHRGMVEPSMPRERARKLSHDWHPVATRLIERILKLSNLGPLPGKPKRSTAIQKSSSA